MELEGIENLPSKEGAIIAPNHSGFAGFDAIMLSYEINRALKRIPRILAHHFWFAHKTTAAAMKKLGILEATTNNAVKLLEKNKIIILFPEGEDGNFKSSFSKYKLQEFKRGFVRLAILTKKPIVPTIIVGAEETHFTLSQLKFTKNLFGAVLPLPLNLWPLPAKWKIKFLEPIRLDYPKSYVENSDFMNKIARQIRDNIQFQLNLEVNKRTYTYFR